MGESTAWRWVEDIHAQKGYAVCLGFAFKRQFAYNWVVLAHAGY